MPLDPGRRMGHIRPVNLFITGTDTGVGKTYVTSLILAALRGKGVDAVGYKPVATGDRSDATRLASASGGLDRELVNPVFLKPALAPMLAAMFENREVSRDELLAGYHGLANAHEVVLVEGGGGWEVPLAATITNKGIIETLAGVPLLAHVIHGQQDLEDSELPALVLGS